MTLHPHLLARKVAGPPTADKVVGSGVNDQLANRITSWVGTMWAFYIFAALALVSLPSVLSSGSAVVIIGWVAQTFLQLVLLAVLQTSANRAGKAADLRAIATYNDVEAVIHTMLSVEQHLLEQDRILARLIREST